MQDNVIIDRRSAHSTVTPYDEVRCELLSLIKCVGRKVKLPLDRLSGQILAQDYVAPLSLPLRDNSAVDGYALGPAASSGAYTVRARTAAGETPHPAILREGDAERIFTGAQLPAGTVTVAMQENVLRSGREISLTQPLEENQNIRRKAEDIGAGDVLIPTGTTLDPRHVAILAAMGQANIEVCAPVRVALFSSGRELCDPGSVLGPAAIHDSNRWMLKALLQGAMIEVEDLGILPDDREAISSAIADAADRADIVLSTGGVSVGEEDHIFAAVCDVGEETFQRKMAVKPGKPVVFGKVGNAVYLGLPGNPVAALVSFQLLAGPAIAKLSGAGNAEIAPVQAVAGFNWMRSAGRTEYFPARVIGSDQCGRPVLEKLGKGGSARLRPLIEAGGLGRVAATEEHIARGDLLDWLPFRASFAL